MKTLLSLPVLVALGLGLSIQAASADWEYTRWGMTPEEVAKASNGDVTVVKGADRRIPITLAKGSYTSGGDTWQATFEFTADNRLSAVVLSSDDLTRCLVQMDTLTVYYGPYELTTPMGSGIGSREWANGRIIDRVSDGPRNPDIIRMTSRLREGLTGNYMTCGFRHEPGYGAAAPRSKQVDAR